MARGLVAPRHAESSWTTDRPHVSWQLDSYPLYHQGVLIEWLHSQGSGVRQRRTLPVLRHPHDCDSQIHFPPEESAGKLFERAHMPSTLDLPGSRNVPGWGLCISQSLLRPLAKFQRGHTQIATTEARTATTGREAANRLPSLPSTPGGHRGEQASVDLFSTAAPRSAAI